MKELIDSTLKQLSQFTPQEQVDFFMAIKSGLNDFRSNMTDTLLKQAEDIKNQIEIVKSGNDIINN